LAKISKTLKNTKKHPKTPQNTQKTLKNTQKHLKTRQNWPKTPKKTPKHLKICQNYYKTQACFRGKRPALAARRDGQAEPGASRGPAAGGAGKTAAGGGHGQGETGAWGGGEWQWFDDSCTIGFLGSVRFEWCLFQCGSGSIGRVTIV
jgi:hypothetical protein